MSLLKKNRIVYYGILYGVPAAETRTYCKNITHRYLPTPTTSRIRVFNILYAPF